MNVLVVTGLTLPEVTQDDALTRRIATAIRMGRDAWAHREELRVTELELEGLTMGIFGFGGTGRAMARRAEAFGMRLLAIDDL